LAVPLLAAGITVFLWVRSKGPQGPTKIPQIGPAIARTVSAAVPQVRFTDITAKAGVRFRHANGGFGKKHLPETMGAGVDFLDIDKHGHKD
jgi:hypothetical protein